MGEHGRARPRLQHCAGARCGGTSDGVLSGLQPDALFRAVNAVRPSTIRIEADEATYGLHIVLRFELERLLLARELEVDDVPEAWNARMQEYLGVEVGSDAEGVLQDVHWSAGLIGYFPTYAIGNLIAGQLWQRVRSDIPTLTTNSPRASCRACASGCGKRFTGTVRVTPTLSCWRRSSADRWRWRRSSNI